MKRLTFVILAVGLLVALPTAAVLSSTNGAWIKYTGNPVLRANPANAWDDFNVYSSHVLWDGSQFRMWYSGTSFTQNEKDIGYATSADGLTWTKHPGNPVLSVGPFGYWDHERINAPTVLYDATDKLWKMWYAGVSIYNGGFSIGYATSPDGINWTKYSDEPIFESSGHPDYWDGISVLAPEVLKKDGKYHMWYSGSAGAFNQIGYAVSNDGINWTRVGDAPVVAIGNETAWDGGEVVSPSVIFSTKDNLYHMWYQGSSLDNNKTNIGHASSPDGINWTKDANPILLGEPKGAWDAERVFYPTVTLDKDGQLLMWYHARRVNSDNYAFKIGVAGYDLTAVPTATPTAPANTTPTPTPTEVVLNSGSTPVPTPTKTPIPPVDCSEFGKNCIFLPSVRSAQP